MAGHGRRVKKELARRHEQQAWRLKTVQGRTNQQIADEIGVSVSAVSKILKRTERRVLEELAAEIIITKVGQTTRLTQMADEAMRAWHASKGPRHSVKKVKPADGPEVLVAEMEESHGDVRYLDTCRRCLAEARAGN